jgi:hypothetical protein
MGTLNAYELAKKYYPQFWDKDRLRKLVKKGKLSTEEYKKITGEEYEE